MKCTLAILLLVPALASAQLHGPGGGTIGSGGAASDWTVEPLLEALPVPVALGAQANGARLAFLVDESGMGAGQDLNGDGDAQDEVLGTYDRGTRRLALTDLDGRFLGLGDGFVAVHRYEGDSGQDLSGDGDTSDEVLTIHDLATGQATTLGTSAWIQDTGADFVAYTDGLPGLELRVYSHATGAVLDTGAQALGALCGPGGVAHLARESFLVGDLNGDGDTSDTVLRIVTPDLGAILNTATVAYKLHGFSAGHVVSSARESAAGIDWNGDGDLSDDGVFVADLQSGVPRLIGVVEDPLAARILVTEEVVFLPQDEGWAGDLNGDGDTGDAILVASFPGTGATLSSGLPGTAEGFAAGRVLVRVPESVVGSDLSGDGDLNDQVAHVWDLGTNSVTNLALPVAVPSDAYLGEEHAVFQLSELDVNTDYNGDGDTFDEYPLVVDLATGQARRVPIVTHALWAPEDLTRGFLFNAAESDYGRDLNGDGDAVDTVLFAYDLGSFRPWNLARTVNQGVTFHRQSFTFYAHEQADSSDFTGDGDTNDRALFLSCFR